MDLPGHAREWPRPPAATTAEAALRLIRQLLVEHGWCQRAPYDEAGRLDLSSALAIACGHEPPRPPHPGALYFEVLDYLAAAIGYTGQHRLDVVLLTNDAAADLDAVLYFVDRAAELARAPLAVAR